MTEMVIIYSTFRIHAIVSEILNCQILKYQERKGTKFKYSNLKCKIRVKASLNSYSTLLIDSIPPT